MMKEYIMLGPALLAATAVSTKIPVPMMAPMPSMVRSNAPSWRFNERFSAVSRISSSDFLRWNSICFSPEGNACGPSRGGWPPRTRRPYRSPGGRTSAMGRLNGGWNPDNRNLRKTCGSSRMQPSNDFFSDQHKQLADYRRRWPDEADVIDLFVELLGDAADPFRRERLGGHFTASAWLVARDGRRVLLTHHRKLGMWLQLGGHADGERDFARVALTEAQEESGLPGLSVEAGIF